MKTYCKLIVDDVTGEVLHCATSLEPLPVDIGVKAEANHTERLIVIDSLKFERARNVINSVIKAPVVNKSSLPAIKMKGAKMRATIIK